MCDTIVLENEKIVVKVLSLGAILNSFYVKELDTDIVLGFSNYDTYLAKNSANMGKSVGRCANRIAKGKFTLDGKEYSLLINNGPNSLHGGEVNFGNKEWVVKEKSATKVVLTYHSVDMEAGYPGNLDVTATYEINGYELKLTYEGLSDKNTVFNMTNHSYFNLDKNKKDILNHMLKIPAERVSLNDSDGMARDLDVEVKNTLFDFRNFKKIGEVVSTSGKPLNDYCLDLANGSSDAKLINNLDNNFIYEKMSEKVICELKNDNILFKVSSDLPDMQIYTGRTIDVEGKDGHYSAYAGIAIEPQFVPNAINFTKYLKPILKANEKIKYTIKYDISKI